QAITCSIWLPSPCPVGEFILSFTMLRGSPAALFPCLLFAASLLSVRQLSRSPHSRLLPFCSFVKYCPGDRQSQENHVEDQMRLPVHSLQHAPAAAGDIAE